MLHGSRGSIQIKANLTLANHTLAIDNALLQRARQEALRNNTSVNALVREILRSDADARSRRLEALARFEAVASGNASSSASPWSRDSLHERS